MDAEASVPIVAVVAEVTVVAEVASTFASHTDGVLGWVATVDDKLVSFTGTSSEVSTSFAVVNTIPELV